MGPPEILHLEPERIVLFDPCRIGRKLGHALIVLFKSLGGRDDVVVVFVEFSGVFHDLYSIDSLRGQDNLILVQSQPDQKH